MEPRKNRRNQGTQEKSREPRRSTGNTGEAQEIHEKPKEHMRRPGNTEEAQGTQQEKPWRSTVKTTKKTHGGTQWKLWWKDP